MFATFWITAIVLSVFEMVTSSEPKPGEPLEISGLNQHNVVRERHKAQPLVHSPWLSQAAHYCAEYYIDHGNSTNHCRRKYLSVWGPLGENIAEFKNPKNSDWEMLEKATRQWYKENRNYDYAESKCKQGKPCASFTQVVWNSTNKIGMGLAKREAMTVVMALYSPPGNQPGSYKQNVFPLDTNEGNS